MPEYVVDPSLSKVNEPGVGTRIVRGARAIWNGLEAIEDAKDQGFVDLVKFTTNGDVDLTELIEAKQRTEKLAGVVGGPLEALVIDTVITRATSGGADLSPALDVNGNPVRPAQLKVGMLPMWEADP